MASTAGHAPATHHLERDHILQDIFENVDRFADRFTDIDFDVLKRDVLQPVIDNNFDPEVQIRGFMRALQHTSTYKNALANISDPKLQTQINDFVAGKSSKDIVTGKDFEAVSSPSPPVKHHFSLVEALKKLTLDIHELKAVIHNYLHPMNKHLRDLPVLIEIPKIDKVVEVYSNLDFANWGLSVNNTPKLTFFPTTVLGVQEIVKYAIRKKLRVRCGGYRHSWSPTFSQTGELLISFINLEEVTTIPDPLPIAPGAYNSASVPELSTIELKEKTATGNHLCRIGAAVTAEAFRRWAVAQNTYALPVDTILVEVTFGGVNAMICHGAGRAHPTICDYVRAVEYVDCKGNLKMVNDPTLIKAAAGSFGLLGVVTHLTLELESMTYAIMQPRKVDIGLAIPPLQKEDIPPALREDWFYAPDVSERLATATADFESSARDDYYAEWFWFTYQRKGLINTWNRTADATGVFECPSVADTFLQWIEGWLGGVLTGSEFFRALPGYWQAQLLATSSMAALPPTMSESEEVIMKTALPNALHFRRGTQNMRVRDFEMQIPLQPRKDDTSKPDFDIVRRAWWDVIKLVYAEAEHMDEWGNPKSPMRLTLELRITGGSELLMAAQRGNGLGTAGIEVLSVPNPDTDREWKDFIQKLLNAWMGYGVGNLKPHWAKEWDGLQVKDMPVRDYLKKLAYPKEIQEFKQALDRIGGGEWGVEDLKKRFSNELWDEIIFS